MTMYLVTIDIPKQTFELDAWGQNDALTVALRRLRERFDEVIEQATCEVKHDDF